MKQRRTFILVLAVILLILLAAGLTLAQGDRPPERFASTQDTLGTAFTYQGQLKKDNIPVNTICDLSFSLWDAASGGTQIGADQIRNNISVTHGLFTIPDLDFGTFTGEARWLQIAVQCAGETLSTLLTPRQALTAAPYALYAPSTGALRGYPVTTTAPTAGQALKWNGSAWSPGVDNDTTYTAGPGLVLTGTQFSIEGSGYGNVLVVAKSGGDFTAVQAALDSITDASAANRYLVWIAPGTYTETVTMKSYVDIEGAGELLTEIVYTGTNWTRDTGTVIGADNAELRFLTVKSHGVSEQIAIYNRLASPRLTHVTAIASSYHYAYGIYNDESSPKIDLVTIRASHGSTGHAYGIYNLSSAPSVRHVTISTSGGDGPPGASRPNKCGVYNLASSPTMDYVAIVSSAGYGFGVCGVYNESSSLKINSVSISVTTGTGNAYGVWNMTSTLVIQNSVISALTLAPGTKSYGIYNLDSSGTYTVTVDNSQIIASTSTISNSVGFTTLVGASKLEGGSVFTGTGTVICAGVYDENYAFYANTCP